MQTRFLKPAPGLKVRHERTAAHIPAEGMELELTSYVRRRLRSGDLIPATPPAPARPAGKTAAVKES